MFLLGIFLIIVCYILLGFLELFGLPSGFSDFMAELPPYVFVLYLIFVYTNAFAKDYKCWVFCCRLILFLGLFAVELIIFLLLLIGAITDWQGGEINYSL